MSTNSTDPCQAFFPADPDIAGVGIRISIYVTTVLLSIITGIAQLSTSKSKKDSNPGIALLILPAAGVQGLVLLVTAIIQTSLRQLSLYHAFIIFHLLAFLGVHMGSSLLKNLNNENAVAVKMILAVIFSFMGALAGVGWGIYMLVHAPTFGPADQHMCNDRVLYVFFFKSVHATTKWVRIVLGIFGVLPITINIRLVGPILHAVYGVVTLELMIRRNRFIVEDGERAWGFGQVLAMILLIAPFKELVDSLGTIGEIQRSESGPEISSPGLLRSSVKLVSLIRKLISSKSRNDHVSATEMEMQDKMGEANMTGQVVTGPAS